MKVHLSDIARRVGVSRMTVSRALREDPAVAVATREKVLVAARDLGYTPNPKLARLMSEMASSRSKLNNMGELALITSDVTEFGWQKHFHQRSCYEGAQAQAHSYGYKILPVWALSRRYSNGGLSDFLWSRGVDGLVIMPIGEGMIGKTLDIRWERFCTVQIGATLSDPKISLVRHNHYDGMIQTLLQLEKLGHERIGLCFSSTADVRSYHRWASAYLYWRTLRGFSQQTLPSFYYRAGVQEHRKFRAWINQYSISAVVGMDAELVSVSRCSGIRIPQDLSFCVLDQPGEGSPLSGIDQIASRLGGIAIDMLLVSVRKGVKGIPAHPVSCIIEGKWVAGETAAPFKYSVPRKDFESDVVQEGF